MPWVVEVENRGAIRLRKWEVVDRSPVGLMLWAVLTGGCLLHSLHCLLEVGHVEVDTAVKHKVRCC